MRIEIVDDNNLPTCTDYNRIEEIEDTLDVETCFICNNKPTKSKTIFHQKGKQ